MNILLNTKILSSFFNLPAGFKFSNLYHLLAFGLGSGLFKKAPGTWGSLAGVFIYLIFLSSSSALLWTVIIISFFAGIYLCNKTSDDLGVHDHGGIVWDEFVGQWITLAFLPLVTFGEVGLLDYVFAFILFRFFDIVKPWPIAWLDKNTQGGVGIMIDDVVAGVFAGLALCLVYYFSPINPYI